MRQRADDPSCDRSAGEARTGDPENPRVRRLAVVAASPAGAKGLGRWREEAACQTLLLDPLPGESADGWKNEPIVATNHARYAAASRHFALCAPLFELGARNDGPHLPDFDLSFVACADFALASESRQLTPLWLDLTRLAKRLPVETIELVAAPSTPSWLDALCRAFARVHGLGYRALTLGAEDTPRARRRLGLADLRLWAHSWLACWRPRALFASAAYADPHPASVRQPADDELTVGLLVYHPKAWSDLLPVREALLEAGHRVVLISPRRATDRPLAERGLSFYRAHPRWPGWRLLRRLRALFAELPLPADGELAPLTAAGGPLRRRLLDLALLNSPIYAGMAYALPRIDRRERFDLVLTTDSGSVAGRCWTRWAQRRGLPAAFLQHGGFSRAPHNRHYFVGQTLLVWGPTSAERLCAVGVEHTSRIEIVGSPRLESKIFGDSASGSSESLPEGLPASPFVLVTFGIPGGFMSKGAFARAADEVLNAAEAHPRLTFAVKPHPGDATDTWERRIGARRTSNVLILRSDTYELMRHCLALITMASTTGAEATLLDKPVIAVGLGDDRVESDYVEAGAAYDVGEPGELAAVLGHVVDAPAGGDRLAAARRRFARDFLHVADEPAASRIAGRLEALARAGRSG